MVRIKTVLTLGLTLRLIDSGIRGNRVAQIQLGNKLSHHALMNNGISRLEGSWITRRGTSINKKRKLTRLSHFRRIVNSDEETVVNLHELATLALRGSSSVELLTKASLMKTVCGHGLGNSFYDGFHLERMNGRTFYMRRELSTMYPPSLMLIRLS
jgi:hypothetical protein